ncbi:hypothetical protein [Streptomyces cahuitamycinicus]|uniref:Uncharacterized protein n=1 Tax=Streptomyces cahuitamycinicus TaxID=2070367 RepID=A0A2N8TF12_9ACTN|nr:hypothetical protein [Streptomyces cahuitamycinicus]PNG17597.1 hypothetical protein C1J00_35710 [Streptomyces cahuitamycinicus]
MTRQLTNALAGLYALLTVCMLRCALISYEHGSLPYTAFFSGVAVALATAIAHHAYLRDELRAAHVQLERAARPPRQRTSLEDGVVRVALAAACCERWWTSAGAEHDPDHCTRKDTTR